MSKINAQGQQITLFKNENDDYISLTDIAKYKSEEPNDVIKNWLRSKDTLEFLWVWENINNPNFKPVEFDGFKNQAGIEWSMGSTSTLIHCGNYAITFEPLRVFRLYEVNKVLVAY